MGAVGVAVVVGFGPELERGRRGGGAPLGRDEDGLRGRLAVRGGGGAVLSVAGMVVLPWCRAVEGGSWSW